MCVFVVPATQTPARCWGNSDFVNLMCVVGKWGETGLSPQGRWGLKSLICNAILLWKQWEFPLPTTFHNPWTSRGHQVTWLGE